MLILDLNNNEILADFKNVSSAKLCTKIENKFGASVSTIEHLMAAFYICGIDNLIIDINGPEIPIMDGSSSDFVRMIENTGVKTLDKKREFVVIKKRVELKDDKRSIIIEPANSTFKVKFTLSYKNPLIGNQENFIDKSELTKIAKSFGIPSRAEDSIQSAFENVAKENSDAIIFCTGSLYFAGEILNLN